MLNELIAQARQLGCSDVHLTAGRPAQLRLDGMLRDAQTPCTAEQAAEQLVSGCTERIRAAFAAGEDVDFAWSSPDGGRQRVNIYRQDGGIAVAIRLLNSSIPSLDSLGLPAVIGELADRPRGLVLVTGPTGSGKSTTLAAMLDRINRSRAVHIVTAEDPIEYVHRDGRALIHQREVGRDVPDFASALRSALREDPDVILVGEMRDFETISPAVTAAETGHLVLSTLHTTGAAQTVDRIVDACPAEMQRQMRVQLASVLRGVVTQALLPRVGGGRVAATEVLIGTDAVCNLIRESKTYQLPSSMQAGQSFGMHTFDMDLSTLARRGLITRETAQEWAFAPRDLML